MTDTDTEEDSGGIFAKIALQPLENLDIILHF